MNQEVQITRQASKLVEQSQKRYLCCDPNVRSDNNIEIMSLINIIYGTGTMKVRISIER